MNSKGSKAVDSLLHVRRALPELVIIKFEFRKDLLSVWGVINGELYHVSKWVPNGDWDGVVVNSVDNYDGRWCSVISGRLRQ